MNRLQAFLSSEAIKAAYYFSDCGAPNFWSSCRKDSIESELSFIKENGFNSIVLLVPWAALQPDIHSPTLDPSCVQLLHAILAAAERQSLKVILRVGYLWESSFIELRTFERYASFESDPAIAAAWSAYCAQLQEILNQYSTPVCSFLSWEDFFWPRYRMALDSLSAGQQLEHAKASGFFGFVQLRVPYDPEGLFGVPIGDNPLLKSLYIEYLDAWIRPLFFAAKREIPLLQYEYRSDKEHIIRDGKLCFHYSARAFEQPDMYATYYNTYTVEDSSAVDNLARWCELNAAPDRKLFISQFNFIDNTFRDDSDFADYGKVVQEYSLAEHEAASFLEAAGSILKKYTCGYAVWALKDVINDHIFNSAFQQGTLGFDLTPPAQLTDRKTILFEAGGALTHRVGYVRMEPARSTITLRIVGRCLQGGEVKLSLYGDEHTVGMPEGDFDLRIVRSAAPTSEFEIGVTSISASFTLEKISLFNIVLSNNLYLSSGEPREACNALKRLNASWSASSR